jgi:hypothetical protein
MTPAGIAPPAWSDRLISELDAADQTANEVAMGLNAEQLNWQPAPGVWSVGQCLEHLCITNEAYLPAISCSLSGKPISAVQDIKPGWFGRWFISSYVEPSARTKHVRAPKKLVPSMQVKSSVLKRFLLTNEAVREIVRHASGYDVNRIRFRNPLIPGIRFTIGTGLEIVSKHERRHLLQAERTRRSAAFPAS